MNVCSESEKKIFLFFIFLSETIIKNLAKSGSFASVLTSSTATRSTFLVKRLSNLSVLRSLLQAF